MEAQLDKGAMLVANAASKDITWPVLQAVRIGDGEIVAVDGRILVRYPINTQGEGHALIPATDVQHSKIPRYTDSIVVSSNDETCTLDGESTIQAPLIKGTFPELWQVYPTKEEGTVFSVAFSRKLLKQLISCLDSDTIHFDFVGEERAVKFECGKHHGLIMPMVGTRKGGKKDG